jgi:phage terminase large subunit
VATPTALKARAKLKLRERAQLKEAARARYRGDPAAFAIEQLGVQLTPDQEEVLLSVRDNLRTFVKAGNGVGKSFISSVVIAWTMECFNLVRVTTGGPSFAQTRDNLWTEIRSRYYGATPPLQGHLLPKEPRWDVSHEHFAQNRAADSEESFKGAHTTGRQLVVLDEGPGVAEFIYTAADTMLQGPDSRLLVIGNPTVTSGRYFDAFNDPNQTPLNSLLTLSPKTHPNILTGLEYFGITWDEFLAVEPGVYQLPMETWHDPFPGAVSLVTIDLFKGIYGVGTPAFDAIVLGQFPSAGDKAIINLNWLDAAREGAHTFPLVAMPPRLGIPTGRWAGLDVARFGQDRSALVKMENQQVVSAEWWQGAELDQTAGHAAEAIHEGYVVNIDVSGGLGGGVVSHLKTQGFAEGVHFRSNNAGAKADDDKSFPRMRDQLWFDTADLLRAGVVDFSLLPLDIFRLLKAELSSVLFDLTLAGQRRAETKEQTKKRLRRSPDIADALNLALWRPFRVSSADALAAQLGLTLAK